MVSCACFCYIRWSNRGIHFESAVLISFSVFNLILYLVLITVRAENLGSHKYEEANGIKVLIALLVTIG